MGIPSPVTRDDLRNINAFSGYAVSRGFRISGKNCRSREPNDQHITREKAYISQKHLFSPDSTLAGANNVKLHLAQINLRFFHPG